MHSKRLWYNCAVFFMEQQQIPVFTQPDSKEYFRRSRKWRITGAIAASSSMLLVPLAGAVAQAPEVFAAVVIPLTIAGISLRRMSRYDELAYERKREEEKRVEPEPQYEEIKPLYPPVPNVFE